VRGLQRALFETHVLQGYLVCPASGTKFPITNGIPNFVSPTSIHLHNAHASVCLFFFICTTHSLNLLSFY
jgi:hypothetical protein